MDKKRIQELNAMLLSNTFDHKVYEKFSLDESFAMFRLAVMHHANLKKQLSTGTTGKPAKQKSNLAANGAMKQAQDKALKMFIEKSNYFYALSIERMKALDAFYVAYDASTNMPFAFCEPNTYNDLVWVFTSEEKINQVIEQQKSQHLILKGEKIENSGFLRFFTSLFYIGIDHLLFDYGTDGMMFSLEHICKKPDFDKIENKAAALNNPSLVLSALYFLQEARKQIDNSEKKNLPQLEEEMSSNLIKSSYLIPFVKSGSDEPGKFQVPYFKDKAGNLSLPIFTDLSEFAKYNQESKFQAVIMDFKQLANLAGEHKGIIINPSGFNMYIERSLLGQFIKRFEA